MLIKNQNKIYITSKYGWRVRNGENEFHPGIDIRVIDDNKIIMPIIAPEKILIINVGESKWGNYIEAEPYFENGVVNKFVFFHLMPHANITPGEIVEIGGELGVPQIKGLNKLYHLHFETHKTMPFDPIVYLRHMNFPYDFV